MRVIAKAYGEMPLERVMTGKAHGLVYVVSPSTEISTLPGSPPGVGFPADAVFQFDSELLEALRAAHAQGDQEALDQLWRSAAPVELSLAA